MKIDVDHKWVATDKDTFEGGTREIENPSKKLLKAVALAEHAGVVKVVSASREEREGMKGHVESDSESEKKRIQAMKDGGWYEGNLQQYLADVDRGDREHFGAPIDPERYVAERKGLHDRGPTGGDEPSRQ